MTNYKIGVIGLGYVGLPLAHAFSEKYSVVGFDIAQWRIDELQSGVDRTLELTREQVNQAISNGMQFTNILDDISDCNIYIVTVPTPIDKHKKPDLTPLLKASESIGKVLKKMILLSMNQLYILVQQKRSVFLSWKRYQD